MRKLIIYLVLLVVAFSTGVGAVVCANNTEQHEHGLVPTNYIVV